MSIIDFKNSEEDKQLSKGQLLSSYNKLLMLLDLEQDGVEFLPEDLLEKFEMDLKIVRENQGHYEENMREYVSYAIADAELIIEKMKKAGPRSLIDTLKEKKLIK